jgi:hypothetical protein
MTEKTIKKFAIDGESSTIEDAARIRREIENIIIEDMRHRGYVPILDIDRVFTTSYDVENDKFNWRITVQGVYVGKIKSWEIEGIASNLPIRSTALTKSRPS